MIPALICGGSAWRLGILKSESEAFFVAGVKAARTVTNFYEVSVFLE